MPAADVLYRSCAAAGITPEVAYEAYDYQEVQAMVAAPSRCRRPPRGDAGDARAVGGGHARGAVVRG
jgi:hypothetical protein